MSAVSGAISQAILTQIGASVAMVKNANQTQQAIVEMVAATVDANRGQNLNISV